MGKHAVLITGAAVRVGRAIALEFAHAGYDVLLHYRNSEAQAQATAEEIRRFGVACHLLKQDLVQVAGLGSFMEKAFQAAPHLSVLVNSASVFEPSDFTTMTLADYRQNMALHLDAPVFLTQAFAHHCADGAVVNIVDSFTRKNKSGYFAYLLSKKALADFTRMAAVSLAPKIRVNAVFPGIMLPSGNGFDEAYMKQKPASLPLKKLAAVPDVARTVLQLAASPHLTGQAIYIDGGEQLL